MPSVTTYHRLPDPAASPTARRITGLVAGLAALLALLPAAGAVAGEDEKYPVPYNFLGSALIALSQVDADPPGANDWDCRPSRRNPRPVLLVHGLGGNKNTNWQTYAPLLANHGYCVFALTYGVADAPTPLDQFGGMTRIQRNGRELKRFVRKVRRATGARNVDLLGHSEGTVVSGYYLKFLRGNRHVKRLVSLAPVWHGTDPAALGTISDLGRPFGMTGAIEEALAPHFASGPQLLKGSRFMRKMRRGGTVLVRGVEYTNLVTKYDQLVVPYTSGIEPGARNIVIQNRCAKDYAEHFEIAADPVTARIVLNRLAPRRARQVPCRLVLPYVGG